MPETSAREGLTLSRPSEHALPAASAAGEKVAYGVIGCRPALRFPRAEVSQKKTLLQKLSRQELELFPDLRD